MNESEISHRKVFVLGILINILNPKVALFFVVFLSQFIVPNHATNALLFIVLGLALFSARLSFDLRKNYKIKMYLDKMTNGIFVALEKN